MTVSRRLLDVLEPRLPAVARALATPSVRGTISTEGPSGSLWRATSITPRALVVYLTDSPALARWLAGSVALRLRALVFVPGAMTDAHAIAQQIDAARSDAAETAELPADAPIAIVAEADACPLGLTVSRSIGSRLALLYPTDITADAASGTPRASVPTTLIQAAAAGTARASVVALERALRGSGTAVRETEYDAVVDGWARYPKVSTGSRRALEDLVAFLDRGIGEASTFDVIPGWDLH